MLFSTCHSTETNYSVLESLNRMEPQRIRDIKESLDGMSMEELQQMSDNLNDLIQVLVTRQVAIEDTILDRLETAFTR